MKHLILVIWTLTAVFTLNAQEVISTNESVDQKSPIENYVDVELIAPYKAGLTKQAINLNRHVEAIKLAIQMENRSLVQELSSLAYNEFPKEFGKINLKKVTKEQVEQLSSDFKFNNAQKLIELEDIAKAIKRYAIDNKLSLNDSSDLYLAFITALNKVPGSVLESYMK